MSVSAVRLVDLRMNEENKQARMLKEKFTFWETYLNSILFASLQQIWRSKLSSDRTPFFKTINIVS